MYSTTRVPYSHDNNDCYQTPFHSSLDRSVSVSRGSGSIQVCATHLDIWSVKRAER